MDNNYCSVPGIQDISTLLDYKFYEVLMIFFYKCIGIKMQNKMLIVSSSDLILRF